MLLPSTVPAPSVTVPTNGGSSGRKSKSSRTHRSRRRNAPSAASTVSSQLDRPYLYAFLTLLVIYMMVTLLTYEKLSRNHHPSPPSDQQELKQDSPPSQVVRTLEDHPLQPKSQNGSPGKTNGQAFSSSRPIRNVEEMQHHSFPLHVTKADMETIRHPGLELVNDPSQIPQNIPRSLVVPQFWGDVYASVYNASHSVREFLGNGTRIMTPQEASMIGSYAKVAATGEKDDESSMRETIYCSVASYRDYECTPTVQDIYERAKYPERIRVAVIDQSISGTDEPCLTPPTPCSQDPDQVLCKYRHLMDYYHLDAQLAVGPVFARHLAHRMYRGEYYAMQVDSHVRFTQDWDDDIIRQWKSANNEYAVLTAYLSDIHKRIDPVTHVGLSASRPIMCKSDYEGGGENRHLRHGQQPEGVPGIHGQPVLEPFWAAGYSFARGHFVLQVPYDQYLPMIFQGEEISIGLRGFTYGYDYYTPERGTCFHIYASQDTTHKRRTVPMFWENNHLYHGAGTAAMKRLNTIIGMAPREYPPSEWPHEELHTYGLGQVRTTTKFFETFGIHTKEQRVEHNLCKFVGRPMMQEFLPALRSNRMGLDYDKIQYVYVDRG